MTRRQPPAGRADSGIENGVKESPRAAERNFYHPPTRGLGPSAAVDSADLTDEKPETGRGRQRGQHCPGDREHAGCLPKKQAAKRHKVILTGNR